MKIRMNRGSRQLASENLAVVSSLARNGRLTRLKQILVPVDFSWASRMALDYTVPLARKLGASIHLLHVLMPRLYPGPLGDLPVPTEDELD